MVFHCFSPQGLKIRFGPANMDEKTKKASLIFQTQIFCQNFVQSWCITLFRKTIEVDTVRHVKSNFIKRLCVFLFIKSFTEKLRNPKKYNFDTSSSEFLVQHFLWHNAHANSVVSLTHDFF